MLGLGALGLGALGLGAWANKHAKNRNRWERNVMADAETGEMSNLSFPDYDWKKVVQDWGPGDTVYHPKDDWSWARVMWENLPQDQKDAIHASGKSVHEWVDEGSLPAAPVKIDEKLYAPTALKGKASEFFKKLGLDDIKAESMAAGDYGNNQFRWTKKPQGYGLTGS